MKNNFLKFGLALIAILAFSVGNAQSTTDVVKGPNAVKVIDNKGTIRYFQSNNGVTQIVNTTANITTTTWQLGGTLTDDTYIDVDGNIFALNGIESATLDAATTIGSGSSGSGTTDSGWALLVRDEATGKTQKLLATDLVDSGNENFTAGGDNLTGTFTLTVTGMPAAPSVLWVYRNGAKLVSGTDYMATAVDEVTIAVNPGTSAASWVSYQDDVYEVYWVK